MIDGTTASGLAGLLAGAGVGPAWVRFFGRLHPLVVHFPVALLLAAAVVELFRLRSERVAPSARVCLLLGTLAAPFAVCTGLLNFELERHSAALTELVSLHRNAGIATTVLALAAAALLLVGRSQGPGRPLVVFRAMLLACGCLVGVTGYLGGSLTHGRGHLLQPFRRAAKAEPTGGEHRADTPVELVEPGDLAAEVAAVFARSCVECHGPDEQSGDLRLDDLAGLFAGPRDLWVVQPRDPAGSLLFELITLPVDDPERMPEDGEPLPAEELATIAAWIEQGAPPAGAGASAAPGAGVNVGAEGAAAPVAGTQE